MKVLLDSFHLNCHTRVFYIDPGFDSESGRVSVRKFVWFNMRSSVVGIYLRCCNGFIQSNTRYDIFHPSYRINEMPCAVI